MLASDRIRGVETGGCPHTAIREDASVNLAAVEELIAGFPGLEVILIESGGDNLSAAFGPELSDLTLYVIDVCAGEEIPRKGGPWDLAIRPADHQQDRPCPAYRHLASGDGAGHEDAARRTLLRVYGLTRSRAWSRSSTSSYTTMLGPGASL